MPYKSTHDLPKSVQDHLPKHAQEIYLNAFNSAWEEYKNPAKRSSPADSLEEVAAKVAWGAVKKTYEKKGDHWIKKDL